VRRVTSRISEELRRALLRSDSSGLIQRFAEVQNRFVMLFVFICLIGHIAYKFIWNVGVNGFYIILGYSLPKCDLQLICSDLQLICINTQ